DGSRFYFPTRIPLTVVFDVDESDTDDQYGVLQSRQVVDAVNALQLPRYGLGNYVKAAVDGAAPTPAEAKILSGLSRAGQRLMGFCRTNLFKRLESGGPAFIQSLQRHALRNFIFLHALRGGLDLPIGTQEAELLDAGSGDLDPEEATLLSGG